MTIARTLASTGRSMKKREIICDHDLPGAGSAAVISDALGATFAPGTARCNPDITTRSSGCSPVAITRRSPTRAPVVTVRCYTTSSLSTTSRYRPA
jgi:hypothetical protein